MSPYRIPGERPFYPEPKPAREPRDWSGLHIAGAWLAVAVSVAGMIAGCRPSAPAQSVENAAAVAQYGALLDECIAKGKAAGSLAVYVACADDLDRTLCRTNGTRCQDGGR